MELSKMGGTLTSPTAPQMTDVSPNRWGEPVNRPLGREEVRPLGGTYRLVSPFIAPYLNAIIHHHKIYKNCGDEDLVQYEVL